MNKFYYKEKKLAKIVSSNTIQNLMRQVIQIKVNNKYYYNTNY